MRIAIDCRMLMASGVGVYLRGVLPYIAASGHGMLLIVNKENRAGLEQRVTRPLYTSYNDIYEWNVTPFSPREFCPPFALRAAINACDGYWTPFFNIPAGINVPVCATIHDIIFPDMPELTSRLGLLLRMFFYRRAFRRSKALCTVSAFSAARIRHYASPVAPDLPVVVTYSALQHYILTPPAFPKTKTILFVGNIKKHKGLSLLLRAFRAAREAGLDPAYELVIAGSKECFRTKDRQAEAALPGLPVRFTGPLSDERLYRLYAEAALLVQPSLYEGFGLPPLEAMCLGTQALVSDIPVFREIYSDFPVVFFRSGDSEDLARALTGILRGAPPKITLTEGQKNCYTFEKTSAAILFALKQAFQSKLTFSNTDI